MALTIDRKPCMFCGNREKITVDITKEQYRAWLGGTPIQIAMPNLTVDEREVVKTGICGSCWDTNFGAED